MENTIIAYKLNQTTINILKNIANVHPITSNVTINDIQNCLANLLSNEIILHI